MHRSDIQIRDPFVLPLPDERRYILYGTTDANPWNAPGTGFDAWVSDDLEEWTGPHPVFRPRPDFWGTHDFWAPEVHAVGDAWYMFATFIAGGRKRGTQILRAESPLGPFEPWSHGPVTPREWQCLDGTLHVERGTGGRERPWLVFCHEWVEVHDGEMCALPLRPDLTGAAGDAQILFRASSAPWPRPLPRRDGSGTVDARVTDGPFLHRTAGGTLVMLWSSLGDSGYVMGYAVSESGTVAGPWRQHPEPLVATDGGHGMLFRDFAGRLLLTYHSPNTTPHERFRYVEVEESGGGLRRIGDARAD